MIKMKKLFFLIVFSCFSLSSFSQKIEEKEGEFIEWKEGVQLKWEDFLAIPDSSIHHEAISSLGFKYKFNQDTLDSYLIRPVVLAVFYPSKSWTKGVDSDNLLQHEQLHFDILELIARQLRKELKGLEKEERVKLDEIYQILNQYVDKLDVVQDQYDKETGHSIAANKQREWAEKIKKELALYKEYHLIDVELQIDME